MDKKLTEKIEALKKAYPEADADSLIEAMAQMELDKESAEAALKLAEKDTEELNEKLADYESGKVKKIPKPTVKVGGTTYTIRPPKVIILGKEFTALQVKENKETVEVSGKSMKIADYLVQKRSGVLKAKD